MCGVDEAYENGELPTLKPEMLIKNEMTNNCVRIYYEMTNALFKMNSSNETETLNWITAVHNNIHSLYANDNIKIALSEVMVWTSDDPYDGDPGENLVNFSENRKFFNGDLAHLVNYPTTLSIASIDAICTYYSHAYSGVDIFFEEIPVYSWTVLAMTHEMGHVMGSLHTHDCVWNGNNTAIDGCGYYAGNSSCDGPMPENGGTIMSYCHLTPVGINLANGFGPQPSALIRNNIDSKSCLGTDCINSCIPTVENVTLNEISANHYQAIITDNASDTWGYRLYEVGATPNEWINTNQKTLDFSNLNPYTYYKLDIRNICVVGTFEYRPQLIFLTGDFCGLVFTDTGGTSSNYDNNELLVKTFYPSGNHPVKISFSRMLLQPNADFMYVYNGDSIDSPLFESGILTGNNNPGPTFTSTHPSGAITIKFTSNSLITHYGWEAIVNCDALSIEDISNSKGVSVYPNPTTSVLNIEAQKEIISVKLNDISGKAVLNKKANSSKEKLNIEHLPKGVYILTVEMKGQTVTKKIIKN